MNIIDHNSRAIAVPTKTEETVPNSKEVIRLLQELLANPSTPELGFLQLLLRGQSIDEVRSGLEYSKRGYWWLQLNSNPLFESGLCLWPGGSSAGKHDHGSSRAMVLPLYGGIQHTTYRIGSDGTFYIFAQEESSQFRPFFVKPWQVHNVRNLQPTGCFSITYHAYWWRRKNVQLVAEN